MYILNLNNKMQKTRDVFVFFFQCKLWQIMENNLSARIGNSASHLKMIFKRSNHFFSALQMKQTKNELVKRLFVLFFFWIQIMCLSDTLIICSNGWGISIYNTF